MEDKEQLVLDTIEKSKKTQNYELLSGWIIRRNYVIVRKVLNDHERYKSYDIFRVYVTRVMVIIADLDYNLVEWREIS